MLYKMWHGSRIASHLYDAQTKAGATAHILHPSTSLAHDATNPAKFPATAVPLLIDRLKKLGADPRRLVAKLAGGASMFSQLTSPRTIQMGERNVVAAPSALPAAAVSTLREAVAAS